MTTHRRIPTLKSWRRGANGYLYYTASFIKFSRQEIRLNTFCQSTIPQKHHHHHHHHLHLQKSNLVCSPHVSIEPTIERSLIIELQEKPYCFPSLWSDEMDIETIEVFQNNHLGVSEGKALSKR